MPAPQSLPQPAPAVANSGFFGNTVPAIFQTVMVNKLMASVGLISCLYGALLAKLFCLSRVCVSDASWAAWRLDVPLPVLREIPVNEVADELRAAICTRYGKSGDDASSYFNAVAAFMHDIETEESSLVQLCTLYAWIDWAHLAMLFPKQLVAVEQARSALERLLFLKQVASSSIIRSRSCV